jgi:glycosyltransferase involved in cell wall biosynthesis
MIPVRILVDSFADRGLPNAQMGNAREIIRRLDPSRFHVSVFHSSEPDELIAKRPNTQLIKLPARRRTARILPQFLMGRHDILFYVKSSPASKWYMRWRGKWKDNRIAVGTIESQSNVRDEPTITPEAVRLWEETVLRCDYLFSNSRAVRRNLDQEYGLYSEIVPTGVSTKFFTPAGKRIPRPRPCVLFAGSLRPFKQPQVVLEAAGRFPEADFVLVGEGVMAEVLKEQVRREHLSNVRMTGLLNAEELRGQYQQSDIFLFPSSWEGSPKVILEAAACALPVIARKNYEPETILDGETGYLVGSDEELFARVGELLRNPQLQRKFGEAGRRHVLQFDWDPITRCWEEIFLSLLAQRSEARAA